MSLGDNLETETDSNYPLNKGNLNENDIQEDIITSTEDVENESLSLYCVFDTGGEKYAIPMDLVKEVVKKPYSTPIPQMPDYFSSMANVRGEVYGILDLGLFFNSKKNDLESNYLLVLNHEEYQVAILLNEVPETIKVSESMIEELSSSTFGSIIGKKYLSGIVKTNHQMIILFDVFGIISSEKFTEVNR